MGEPLEWRRRSDHCGRYAGQMERGRADIRIAGSRIYLRFDWDKGRRHGLIDAARDGTDRLVGKYINLTTPAITRPWIGLVVDTARIDGCFPNGRLDFRR
ncbi:hypothetical protein [Bradyrhizobium sp. 139]|uniref:hypothetical protein n=1 Tax=Bradyrhizobium sp. 139 TaxID=2782616 RepID=UPI001FF7B624|nr:hypothetical protein [Bradyrhizobium sp. 139]